ncbi:glycoside hydrolase family 1 protein [Aaosphaeria arxii CBS 175.79]|uniref:Glycoside hydrolase family 1 protein n=1 Tax=Aaosphaeria arxii CBS 175.79 TaxID=1450172 RepID=A0A6A5Y8V8_9PLEO|nr:glycoside hydrolase family 1 protein [Aaosphaeria arxii CBS 175.79]KAF2021181.1 glycoside hydrolase family 1 protein [Aaosphaeria arxii CBS 175.79]
MAGVVRGQLSLCLLSLLASAHGEPLSFQTPSGYSTASFNASAQPTAAINRTDFSDTALNALWNLVGPIATGPVTTTVEPTPEPSVFPQPVGEEFHPLVASHDPSLRDLKLPEGFQWGVSSSSYQIEGAAKDEGKGPSIWDLLSHRVPNWVADNSTGDVVGSHYWLYKQDVQRLKALGIKRFSPSLSWPRFFPFGRGPVNEEGVKHYDDVISELVSNDIHPSITIFHWDTPLALFTDYGAWGDRRIVDDFVNYAKFVITRYDEYVEEWFTINEPQWCNWQYSLYPAGDHYPAFNDIGAGNRARFLCGHHTLLAHAKVAKWYHEEFKGKGRITFKNSGNYYEGNTTSEADKEAAQRNFDFAIGWFGGPWTDGDYPQSLKDTLGDILPEFTEEEKELIKGSCDFYAIDGYTSFVAWEVDGGVENCASNRSHPSYPECASSASKASNGFPLGPAGDPGVSWLYNTPVGLRRFLKHLTTVLFPSIPDIVVTEFGFAEPFEGLLTDKNQILWDLRRADYFQSYLDNILASIHYDKVNVTGAWGWAIMDNFEWLAGNEVRFGLQYVNYTDLTRTPKATFVLADDNPPNPLNPPAPVTSAHPTIPIPPASTSQDFFAPTSTTSSSHQPTEPAPTNSPIPEPTSIAEDSRAKRRRSLSGSDDDSESLPSQPTRGRTSRPLSKRRRRTEETMRLDNDASNPSSSPSRKHTNGSSRSPGPRASLAKVANGDTHGKSETNGASHSNGATLSKEYFGHDREEVTRILIQSLTDLGYSDAAGALCKESGYQLEGPTVASFRSAVLKGDWAVAEELLFGTSTYDHGGGIGLDGTGPYGKSWSKSASSSSKIRRTGGLSLAEGANREELLFWMKQQKYLELLERRELGEALMVLRQELAPLRQDVNRLHALSSFMMCQSAEDLKSQAQWDGAQGESRQILLSEVSKSISPSIMIPPHRLACLLDDVKQSWIAGCLYHNTATSPSLYVDHMCDRNDFPMKAVQELRHHKDEVWYLKYSHDGTKLASASKDNTLVIYETVTYKPILFLTEHQAGVTHLAWSPDDSKIISCCAQDECSARIWDTKTGRCLVSINDFTYPCTTAAWAPDGRKVVIGSQDNKCGLGVWSADGALIHKWSENKLRVHDLAVSPDGHRLVVLLESRILVYDFVTYEKICEWPLENNIKLTSVNISQDSQHMLISMNENKIELTEIDTGEIVQRYSGHLQTEFIIRSDFGGANENFIISGSENSRIFIWKINGQLVESLDGHTSGCVNAVAWHPKDPRVFASAGDDKTVRIWKPSPQNYPSGSSNGYTR